MATCIGCGCTDERACPGGCSWLRVDWDEGLGVCSSCPEDIDRWDAGDHVSADGIYYEATLAMVLHRLGTDHVVLREPDRLAVMNKMITVTEENDELHIRLVDVDDPAQSQRFIETGQSLLVDPTGAPFERAMDAIANHRRPR